MAAPGKPLDRDIGKLLEPPLRRVVQRGVLEDDSANELRRLRRRDERRERAQRVTDEHGRCFDHLTQDAERVVRERAKRVVRRPRALAMAARVVGDHAVTRREAREDVLPILGARETRVGQDDGGLRADGRTGVVVHELRIALEGACARKTLRHRSEYGDARIRPCRSGCASTSCSCSASSLRAASAPRRSSWPALSAWMATAPIALPLRSRRMPSLSSNEARRTCLGAAKSSRERSMRSGWTFTGVWPSIWEDRKSVV